MKYFYKKIDGKVVELEQQIILDLWFNHIIELIIPDGCEHVFCQNNKLTELIIPDSCKNIRCDSNQLKELVIPAGCEEVHADMKSVTELNKVDELNLWI